VKTGQLNYHWTQLLFWSITQGALASALLKAGGTEALQSVQAASIICGLMLNLMLCYTVQCIWIYCNKCGDDDEVDLVMHTQREFATPVYGGMFNVMEYIFSLGRVHPARKEKGMDLPSSFHVKQFVKALVFPFVPLFFILRASFPKRPFRSFCSTFFYTVLFCSWVALFIALRKIHGLEGLGWSVFCCTGITLAFIRNGFRRRYNLRSNLIGDVIASTVFWPQVIMQMQEIVNIESDKPGRKISDRRDSERREMELKEDV
jgi:BCCT, betaine/carnitine/choline family transporter